MELKYLALFAVASLGYVQALPSCPDYTPSIIFYPDQEDCSKFYECFGGILTHMNCPPHLYWNADRHLCDYAVYANCNGRPIFSSSEASTTASTTPSYDPNPKCPASSQNIEFYPDPSSCKQYFECNRGVRFTLVCPADLLYNVNEKACDYPEHVNCVGRSTSAAPKPTRTSTTSTTSTTPFWTTSAVVSTFDPNPKCPASTVNIVFYPDPSNCKQYFECNRGTRFTILCPEELLFNVNEMACDYPEHVDCTGRSTPDTVRTTPTRNSTTTTPSTIRPTTTPSSASGPCANKEDGEYAGDPNDCSIFYECKGHTGIAQHCGSNLYWCQQEMTCDYLNKEGCSCYT